MEEEKDTDAGNAEAAGEAVPADGAAEEAEEEEPKTNEDLLARVHITHAPALHEDFRFWTVEKVFAFAVQDTEIMEHKQAESRAVGSLKQDGVCFVLEDLEDGWFYVESGSVRGFLKKENVLLGGDAFAEAMGRLNARLSGKAEDGADIPGDLLAEELVPPAENASFAYLRATTGQTAAQENYVLAGRDKVNIYESPERGARVVGMLQRKSLCNVLAEIDKNWIYLESGDVRGFARSGNFVTAKDAADGETAGLTEEAAAAYPTAEELIAPSENAALYYTLTSAKEADRTGHTRAAVLEYAGEFIGTPYRFGGNSLTRGIDCSGFVREVYAKFGYRFSHYAEYQAFRGTHIPVKEAQPGDLIFYAKDGEIYHVAISMGGGRTIESTSNANGVTYGKILPNAIWASRVIDDSK